LTNPRGSAGWHYEVAQKIDDLAATYKPGGFMDRMFRVFAGWYRSWGRQARR
jgi:hypothetical protein